MNAGSIEPRAGLLWLCALAVIACERLSADPPPPPSRHEVPAAPPAALGAHLASSPAPAVLVDPPAQPAPDSESEGDGEAETGPDSGKKDAGAPPAPEGVSL
jgi:hypothetical protein